MEKVKSCCFHKPQKLNTNNTWKKHDLYFFKKPQTIMSNVSKKQTCNRFSKNRKNWIEV